MLISLSPGTVLEADAQGQGEWGLPGLGFYLGCNCLGEETLGPLSQLFLYC